MLLGRLFTTNRAAAAAQEKTAARELEPQVRVPGAGSRLITLSRISARRDRTNIAGLHVPSIESKCRPNVGGGERAGRAPGKSALRVTFVWIVCPIRTSTRSSVRKRQITKVRRWRTKECVKRYVRRHAASSTCRDNTNRRIIVLLCTIVAVQNRAILEQSDHSTGRCASHTIATLGSLRRQPQAGPPPGPTCTSGIDLEESCGSTGTDGWGR
jgi:transposase-like protein